MKYWIDFLNTGIMATNSFSKRFVDTFTDKRVPVIEKDGGYILDLDVMNEEQKRLLTAREVELTIEGRDFDEDWDVSIEDLDKTRVIKR